MWPGAPKWPGHISSPVRGNQLVDGDKEFRFFSQNILTLILGEMDPGGQKEFHAPSEGPDWMSAVDDADK